LYRSKEKEGTSVCSRGERGKREECPNQEREKKAALADLLTSVSVNDGRERKEKLLGMLVGKAGRKEKRALIGARGKRGRKADRLISPQQQR